MSFAASCESNTYLILDKVSCNALIFCLMLGAFDLINFVTESLTLTNSSTAIPFKTLRSRLFPMVALGRLPRIAFRPRLPFLPAIGLRPDIAFLPRLGTPPEGLASEHPLLCEKPRPIFGPPHSGQVNLLGMLVPFLTRSIYLIPLLWTRQ